MSVLHGVMEAGGGAVLELLLKRPLDSLDKAAIERFLRMPVEGQASEEETAKNKAAMTRSIGLVSEAVAAHLERDQHTKRMSLRNQFAAQAMAAIISAPYAIEEAKDARHPSNVAELAILYANELMSHADSSIFSVRQAESAMQSVIDDMRPGEAMSKEEFQRRIRLHFGDGIDAEFEEDDEAEAERPQ
jgi:hypothetical protein